MRSGPSGRELPCDDLQLLNPPVPLANHRFRGFEQSAIVLSNTPDILLSVANLPWAQGSAFDTLSQRELT